MPRVPKEWLDAIVYIYPTVGDAQQGTRFGATGFILSIPCADPTLEGSEHKYIITNAHAIRNHKQVAIRINKRAGGFEVFNVDISSWFLHPEGDDLAAMPVYADFTNHAIASVPQSMILDEETLRARFGPGDEVFFIGRYIDLEGKAHNVPTVRSGIVSALPTEPLEHPMGHDQISFLVEARSLSGYSGSPVFIAPGPFIGPPLPQYGPADVPAVHGVIGGPCYLFGVDWGHRPWTEPVRSLNGYPVGDGTHIRGNSGMMMVVPAWRIAGLLEREELVEMRRTVEHNVKVLRGSQQASAVLDAVEPTEFERFEDLTKRLLQVPKHEIAEESSGGEATL